MSHWLVFGSSAVTWGCARTLLKLGETVGMVIGLPAALRPLNSVGWLSPCCPYLEVDDLNDPQLIRDLTQRDADYVLSLWPKKLSAAALTIPRRFVIGTHPTALPLGRGRHPLHWLVAMGQSRSVMSFFRMTEALDAGPLLCQVPFRWKAQGTITDANHAMECAAMIGVCQLVRGFRRYPLPVGRPQDETAATTWRARTLQDVTIDPRMSVHAVIQLVRSFAPPYPCAKLDVRGVMVDIVEASREARRTPVGTTGSGQV